MTEKEKMLSGMIYVAGVPAKKVKETNVK